MGGFLKNYILRVYCQKKNNPRRFVGIVEEPEKKDKKAFTNLGELWGILNSGKQTDTERSYKSWKLSSESRKHIRKDVAFFTGYSKHSSSVEVALDGVIINISKSGICLLTPEALNNGERISIKCNANSPARRATVRWCKQYEDCHCRAGLEFVTEGGDVL
jgi:hypothetical protein